MGILSSELSELLAAALQGLRFGSLEIVVHEGQIVHVERRERLRLVRAEGSPDNRMPRREPTDRTRRTSGGCGSRDHEETAE